MEPDTTPTPTVPAYVPPVASAVVGRGARDAVHLKACVFKNRFVRKSLSCHHVQRRLLELSKLPRYSGLGLDSAYADIDGWYGDLTKNSVAAFQKKNRLPGDGLMNAETLTKLFNGDDNVMVVL